MARPSTDHPASPWHPGELAIQQSIGVVARMDQPGRLFIRDAMPEQHRSFYAQLHTVVLGSVDAQGDAWATVRAGRAGFLRSPDPQTLHVAVGRDADFSLIKFGTEHEIEAESLWTRHRISAYVGRKSRVRVTDTYVRGCAVYAAGRLTNLPQPGHFLTPHR